MNTAQLKAVSWGAAILFGAGLAAYVGNYLVHRNTLEQKVPKEQITTALSKVPNVEKKAEDIVPYDKVNESLAKLNWTAKAPPKQEAPKQEEKKPEIGAEKVETLVKVLMVKQDTTDISGSRAVIKYLPPSQVTTKDAAVVKHVGDTLDAPRNGIIVDRITADGVWFRFSDAKRASEFVVPGEFERRLDMAAISRGESGTTIFRSPEISFPRTANADKPPEHTTLIGDDAYAIGTEDMADWEENYERYLSQIDTGQHRDSKSGKYDGIELSNVPANSVAAAHGVKDGDIIKSINGHAVNSLQEALAFVKNNKDKYNVWEVEIESKGKLKTITYKVPHH